MIKFRLYLMLAAVPTSCQQRWIFVTYFYNKDVDLPVKTASKQMYNISVYYLLLKYKQILHSPFAYRVRMHSILEQSSVLIFFRCYYSSAVTTKKAILLKTLPAPYLYWRKSGFILFCLHQFFFILLHVPVLFLESLLKENGEYWESRQAANDSGPGG